jgi:beta-lactamase superfamily II metal-dependent hydrolase
LVLAEVVANQTVAPALDEVEVSLFGPGYGECVLIHLGLGEWLIMDSCINQYDGGNPALDYLKSLGVSPAEAVKLIIASHWDDDHVAGLADVLRECHNARFVRSSAIRNDEFLELVESAGKDLSVTRSGISEFSQIIGILRERKHKGSLTVAPIWAAADRRIWQRPTDQHPFAEAWALSPSDESITRSLQAFERLLAQQTGTKRIITAPRPNDATCVLWIRVGNASILLGGDLEETGSPGTGWTAILDSLNRPQTRAEVFKVPHHGSGDSDQPRVWNEMLMEEPIAVLAPWSLGKHYLPTNTDQRRICNRTDQAFLTARAGTPGRRRRSRTVDKTIDETVRRRLRNLNGPLGHIQLRRSAGSDEGKWSVQLIGAARRMC